VNAQRRLKDDVNGPRIDLKLEKKNMNQLGLEMKKVVQIITCIEKGRALP